MFINMTRYNDELTAAPILNYIKIKEDGYYYYKDLMSVFSISYGNNRKSVRNLCRLVSKYKRDEFKII